ncbi:MAG: hypothetical protein FWD41_04250 [Actinomycetia bacterium]|nr:hypothetical protein [Actinomycetes bacterium]
MSDQYEPIQEEVIIDEVVETPVEALGEAADTPWGMIAPPVVGTDGAAPSSSASTATVVAIVGVILALLCCCCCSTIFSLVIMGQILNSGYDQPNYYMQQNAPDFWNDEYYDNEYLFDYNPGPSNEFFFDDVPNL